MSAVDTNTFSSLDVWVMEILMIKGGIHQGNDNASTLDTCTADQVPPLGAGMPWWFKDEAMPARVVTPSCCSAWITGEISAARLRAMLARAMALARLPFRKASLVRVLLSLPLFVLPGIRCQNSTQFRGDGMPS
jgi:hypothetical protein